MGPGSIEVTRADALSALAWLVEAGCDSLVDETPRNWLAPPPEAALAPAPVLATPTKAPPPAANALARIATADAATLEAMMAAPDGPFAGRAPLVAGWTMAEAPAVLLDWPDREDNDDTGLASGEAGRLLDRMLAAIDLARSSLTLLPLLPRRPEVRAAAEAQMAAGAAVLHRRLALAKTPRLLIMGDAGSRALLDLPLAAARGRWHRIDGDVQAVATFAPAFLLGQPAQKARAWADLQRFAAGPQ